MTEILLPRIARQGAVCLTSTRGYARKARIEKSDLDQGFQPYHPPFRNTWGDLNSPRTPPFTNRSRTAPFRNTRLSEPFRPHHPSLPRSPEDWKPARTTYTCVYIYIYTYDIIKITTDSINTIHTLLLLTT